MQATRIIEIQPLNKKRLTVTIEGETPLWVHRLPHKLKREFEERNGPKPVKKTRKPIDINGEFTESLYWLDAKGVEIMPKKDTSKHKYWGFPASGLKKAAIAAIRNFKGITMAEMKGSFHIEGYHIVITGTPRIQQESGTDGIWVRINGRAGPGSGVPDIRYRAEFPKWKSTFQVLYNADLITADQLINLFNSAGFHVGLGEDRPGKNGGQGGMFKVA